VGSRRGHGYLAQIITRLTSRREAICHGFVKSRRDGSMTKAEWQMSKETRMTNNESARRPRVLRTSSFFRHSIFVICHWSPPHLPVRANDHPACPFTRSLSPSEGE